MPRRSTDIADVGNSQEDSQIPAFQGDVTVKQRVVHDGLGSGALGRISSRDLQQAEQTHRLFHTLSATGRSPAAVDTNYQTGPSSVPVVIVVFRGGCLTAAQIGWGRVEALLP